MYIYLSTNARAATPRPSGAHTNMGPSSGTVLHAQIHPTCIPQSGGVSVETDADVLNRCGMTGGSGFR